MCPLRTCRLCNNALIHRLSLSLVPSGHGRRKIIYKRSRIAVFPLSFGGGQRMYICHFLIAKGYRRVGIYINAGYDVWFDCSVEKITHDILYVSFRTATDRHRKHIPCFCVFFTLLILNILLLLKICKYIPCPWK
ncbi:hypothetical protein Barb7_02277 [Bacteroidales bacterium Barb7]|nr:hypothetical protein Barb7_02277 [Bacteroidales bacterium Barb7]